MQTWVLGSLANIWVSLCCYPLFEDVNQRKGKKRNIIRCGSFYLGIHESTEELKRKVKNLIKDVHENGVKLDYKEPKLYDVVPKEEIAGFEEVMRETIADIVSEVSGVACWVYVQKYMKHKTLDEMLQE